MVSMKWETPGLMALFNINFKLFLLWPNAKLANYFLQLPKRILFPSVFWKPYQTEYLASVVDRFVQDLEKVLGVKRVDYDIEREWASASLPLSDIPLTDYLATVGVFTTNEKG
jgi:hypothetical protein